MAEIKMFSSKFLLFLALFAVFCLSQSPVLAEKKPYIVYMGAHSHKTITRSRLLQVAASQVDFLASFLGSKKKAKESILYKYKRHINGFAANLDDDIAHKISKHPDVISVFPSESRKLATTRSWDFLSLEKNGIVDTGSLWNKSRFGEDIIIGTLDSGAWPESESFSDEGYGPIPSKWKGICQKGGRVICNRKLLGVRYFTKMYEEYLKKNNVTYNPAIFSARDHEGHGTHTLSTAGGNFVPGVSVFGLGNGTAKGGAPRARLAAYKICWPRVQCADAEIIKAFDLAIDDGVDVLSFSIGGPMRPMFNDSVAIGSFHAVKRGIVVVAAAGNEGPGFKTVSNIAPWMITVGASTMGRKVATDVELQNGERFEGLGLCPPPPSDSFYPLITGAQAKVAQASELDAIMCKPKTLDPTKVKDKIVVCALRYGESAGLGKEARLAGAVGMIMVSTETLLEAHVLPTSNINSTAGLSVYNYIHQNNNPMGRIRGPTEKLEAEPVPLVANFSSRGPSLIILEILKPDIIAPGVNIIAAFPEKRLPSRVHHHKHKTPYFMLSGTSMACPHVAGVAALLKAIHPDWSPAAIKSAMMTTATNRDPSGNLIANENLKPLDPLSYGAGQIQPNRAADPGLVYDMDAKDYDNLLCTLGYNQSTIARFSNTLYDCPKTPMSKLDINYPSIIVPYRQDPVTVTRTLTNVGSPGIYRANVTGLHGITAAVAPNELKFDKIGQRGTFNITFSHTGISNTDYIEFGDLVWSDGTHSVRSPIIIAFI